MDFASLPSVYQIEVTSRCNLKCPSCIRHRIQKQRDLSFDSLCRWVRRGDLNESVYVELQMAGEPLLYTRLADVTKVLKEEAGVAIGLSTNGVLIRGREDRLAGVDAVTISVDSLIKEEYERLRYPAKLADLLDGVAALLDMDDRPKRIDFQAVFSLDASNDEVEDTLEDMRILWGDVEGAIIRGVRDSFAIREERGTEELMTQELCLNPWLSASIRADGSVVSCCYAFDDHDFNMYGNLEQASLEEIWSAKQVKQMRMAHRSGNVAGICSSCYLRSPEKLRMQMLGNWLKEEWSKR